ncbi:MAG: hypothetical protein AAB074_20895 [Planctomycetota bacterium]
MRSLALAASLFLFASGIAFAVDCDGCMSEKMCIRHEKEQTDALNAFRKMKNSKDAMKRKEALDKLGKVNNEHMNHRSKDLAIAIADMLDDSDAGVRMGAVGYLGSNQDVKTATAELGKMLDKLLPRVSKEKPSGKSASSGTAGLEWENALSLVKECLTAMQKMGGEEAAEFCIKAMKSNNLALAADTVPKTLAFKNKKVVKAYLDRFDSLVAGKTEDEKLLLDELARAFAGQTAFAEQLGENRGAWLKKAREWWQEREELYDPPPEPPKKDGE